MQPAQPTPSQLAAARRLNPLILKTAEVVLACVHKRRYDGATAGEVAWNTGLNLVTVRARLTTGTDTLYKRLPEMRRGAHVYVCAEFWVPSMGCIPRRRHRGAPAAL